MTANLNSQRTIYVAVIAGLVLAIGGFLYYAIDVAGWVNEESVTAFLNKYRHSPWAPLYVIGAYILAGITFFPVTIISLAVAAVFGPLWGIVYGMSGILLSASLLFALGQAMRGRKIEKIVGRTALKYDRQLGESGIRSVIILRLVLFAPFSLFNLVGGLSSVKYSDFAVGTLLGLLPGFIARAIVGDSIIPLLFNPTLESAVYLVGGLTLWAFLIFFSHRFLGDDSAMPKPA